MLENTDSQQRFELLIRNISVKPGMYVGQVSLQAVSHYLDGYYHALEDSGQPLPVWGWIRWIEKRFEISNPAWGWARILVEHYGSDEAALKALADLYREFCAENVAQRQFD